MLEVACGFVVLWSLEGGKKSILQIDVRMQQGFTVNLQ